MKGQKHNTQITEITEILAEALWQLMRDHDGLPEVPDRSIAPRGMSQPVEIAEKSSESPCFPQNTEPSCPGRET